MTIGESIRVLRNLRNMTQSALSRATSITKNKLATYENDKCVPDITDLAKLATAFNVPDSALLNDSEALRQLCKPDESLFETAAKFQKACHLNPYAALTAIDTVLFGNNANVRNPATTRFIPPVTHGAGDDNWRKDSTYVRVLAGYSAMLRIETDKFEFTSTHINYNGEGNWPDMASEAMLLQGISMWDRDDFARCSKMIEFYTVFANIGLTDDMTFDEVHKKIVNYVDT